MRFLRVWLIASAVAAVPVLGSSFDRNFNRAEQATRAGHWQEAYEGWIKAFPTIQKRPPILSVQVARCAARIGKKDEAFEWLNRAVSDGYNDVSIAARIDDLKSLRDDPRWPPLLARMQATENEIRELWASRRIDRDLSFAPAFKSYKKLADAFRRRYNDLSESAVQPFPLDYAKALIQLGDERIAASRRYLADHESATDREDVAWDICGTAVFVREPDWVISDRYPDAARQIVERIDGFLRDYPASTRRPEALLLRAVAVFAFRAEGGTKDRPWNDDDLKTVRASLAAITKAFPGTHGGGRALIWNLYLTEKECVGPVSSEMRAMLTELRSTYIGDRDIQSEMRRVERGAILRIDGLGDFEAVDLAGRRWNAASFRDKLTVINVWGRSYTSCVAEIPNLRASYEEFRDRGLQIVGVSLDDGDRQSFESWLHANEVSWPQVWDGKGWNNGLVRRLDVREIPLTILIDKAGGVDQVGLDGEALTARIRELLTGN